MPRYTRRRYGSRPISRKRKRQFKRILRKGRRVAKRMQKVGIYMQAQEATLYVSRRKYKVMHYYAKLIVKHEHSKRRHHVGPKQVGETYEEYHHKKKLHRITKRDYIREVKMVLQHMVNTKWYHRWELMKEAELANAAAKSLDKNHHPHHNVAGEPNHATEHEIGKMAGIAMMF